MAARPTELAIMNSRGAEVSASDAVNYAASKAEAGRPEAEWRYDLEMAKAVRSMALAISQLATGLRASYMLIEQVQKSVEAVKARKP